MFELAVSSNSPFFVADQRPLPGFEDAARVLVDASDDVIFAKDLQGRMMFANQAALAVIGKPLNEVIGRTDLEYLDDPHVARTIMQNDSRVMATGLASDVEECLPYPDGSTRVWLARKTPYRDSNGRLLGMLGFARDITARKQLEEERDLLGLQRQLALDASGMGWWAYQPQTGYVRMDARAREILGLDTEQVHQDAALRLVHEDDRAGLVAAFEQALDPESSQRYAVDYRIVRPDGQTRWIAANGTAMFEGDALRRRVLVLVGTVADVTDRKAIEQALLLGNAQLQRADRQKDEFLATLAHELRNPLAPLRTAVELVRRREALDPMVQRARLVMERQVAHLSRLVDDLLDVSRITRGTIHLQLEEVDLAQLALASVETVRPAMDTAGLALELHLPSAPVPVRGDGTRLTQCLLNLLNNALKFTPRGGRVLLRVLQLGEQAAVEVEDDGVGIRREALDSIFELFSQEAPSGYGGNSGLGIGLALTRKLIELHDGTITASSPGRSRGSTFRLQLPVGDRPTAVPGPPADAVDGSGAHILVVDDNRDAADTLVDILALSGYSAAAAYTGAAALAAVQQHQPQGVLLDIGLPDFDGHEVCRRIRAMALDRQPFIVALTGWGQDKDRERSAAAGFDAHLTKPADPSRVMALLRDLLRS